MWSEDIVHDEVPFLEDGIAREAHWPEGRWLQAARHKAARWSSCAGMVLAFALMLFGWRAFDLRANVDKVVGLSDKGYNCLGEADVLDDMGKQWCCSKGLIPCGSASKLAEDSHDLFSEDLPPDPNRGLVDVDGPHFPPDIAESAEEPTEDISEGAEEPTEDIAESAEEPTEDIAEGAEEPTEDISEGAEEPTEDIAEGAEEPTEDIAEGAEEPTEDIAEGAEEPTEDIAEGAEEPTQDELPTALSPEEAGGLHGITESGFPVDSSESAGWSETYAPSTVSGWNDATYDTSHPWSHTSDWQDSSGVAAAYPYGDSYTHFNDNSISDHVHIVHHHYYVGDHSYHPDATSVQIVDHPGTLPKVDCHSGLQHYEDWSPAMKAHCCATQQVGCAPMKFECKETDGWEHTWSGKQKSFCCATAGKGCEKALFNCHTSSVNQPFLWQKERREWCCLHAKVGCPSYKAPYNCKAQSITSHSSWSVSKKTWCCDHFKTGCAEEPAKLYDCKATSIHAVAGWPDLQKAWCCHHEQVGCTSSGAAMVKYDCAAGYFNWQRGWSSMKKAWCCAKSKKGCEKHFACDHHDELQWSAEEKEYCCAAGHCRSESFFDCKIGFDHWKLLWTSAKKDWCCSSYGRGCTSSDAFDCSQEVEAHTWSESRVMWCCQHRRVGCGTKRSFDCMAGYGNWKEGWSSKKKVYCCNKLQIGCDGHFENLEVIPISETDDYDCTAGFSNWKSGWSDDKKGFCCGKYELGCPPGWSKQAKLHFGKHWSSDWSHASHHVWAAKEFHSSPGGDHFESGYDCITDFEHWRVSWSSNRARFCCQKYSVACDNDNSE